MIWTKSLATVACTCLVGMTPQARAEPAPIVAPTIADPLKGLDLWRGAKIGMNVAQIKALFPDATTPPQPTTLTGGEVDRLQLAGVELAGYPAAAHFYFYDNELISVQLSLTDLKPAASAQNIAMAKHISADFSNRYGPSYDCGDKSFADMVAYECKWLRKPLSIRLWYMDTAGQAPLFYIAYRQAEDPGYNL